MYLGLAAALAAWYNVVRHYTGPERSGVAIHPQGPCPEDEVYDEESVYASGRM